MTRHFSVAIMALFSTIGCSAPTSAGPDASNVTEKAMANAAMPQAPSAVAEQAPQNPLPGADHATIHQSLKSELAGTGQIDGAMISDVQMVDRCHTRFVTPMTSITVNWSKVGNFAARTEQGKVSIPITDDRATHIMTMPNGDDSRRVDGSMGLLADDCQS
ncbi:hypothetical protein [Sphingomonas paucimobilis]|uniref:hypothetical protein n=1 Tax=Sphingomonas paucimobilis TaxID=13689 RepID=UPI0028D28BD1|nr:hypothetical protein [Sphingomonas paucimobilis]